MISGGGIDVDPSKVDDVVTMGDSKVGYGDHMFSGFGWLLQKVY